MGRGRYFAPKIGKVGGGRKKERKQRYMQALFSSGCPRVVCQDISLAMAAVSEALASWNPVTERIVVRGSENSDLERSLVLPA